VPVSSGEEGQGSNAQYECCTFRGSVAALNIATGAVLWQTYSIAEPAKPIGKNNSGTTRYGPAGAGIWSAPTVDPKRHVVYAATGNMYTEPAQPTSDAVLAFDMDTGKIVWSAQALFNDVFMVGCGGAGRGANCPQAAGPDFDFGNSPILAKLPNGRDAIVIGQKSGIGWAFDPDNKGAVLWKYQAGRGSALGGMEWGSAVDGERAYFAISDTGTPQPGGLHAVKLDTGERVWFAPPTSPKCAGRGCTAALSAAITVIPGVVFVGGMDGAIRGHSTKDGSVVWEFDTNREFETVNGVKASGASINQAGPTVANGMLYVSSGYGSLGGRPGNVLLAFGVQ
jgi:polyvinyl alcohol dehydrogenase (cytochrome)